MKAEITFKNPCNCQGIAKIESAFVFENNQTQDLWVGIISLYEFTKCHGKVCVYRGKTDIVRTSEQDAFADALQKANDILLQSGVPALLAS